MKRILVVDDEAMNLKMAEFILKQKNYQVLTASSGMECLTVLQNEMVDLVLLDVEMPMMSGIKTLECMRENKPLQNLPVMFLTADTRADTVIAAGKLGAVGYVVKPFLPEDLLERIEQVLEN